VPCFAPLTLRRLTLRCSRAAMQLRHQQTLASSDTRAVAWSALEVLVLAGLSGLQMVFFRRAFKNY